MVTCGQRNRAAALHGTGAATSSIGAPNAAMQVSQGLISQLASNEAVVKPEGDQSGGIP